MLRTHYEIQCDICGEVCEMCPTPTEALQIARERGWARLRRDHAFKDRCPTCIAKIEYKKEVK